MSNSLFLSLEAGAVLVTDLPKQAEQFRLAFAKWKRAQGITAWSSPDILSWSEWLKRMGENLLWAGYSGSQGVRSLLTPLQEQTVWEQVIRAEINQPLLHLPSTAALARQAWGLMQSWRMPDPSAALYPSDDVQSYSKWVSNYYKRCKTAAWLDQARLPDTLKRAISKNNVKLPKILILGGFVQLTPQQFELVSAIKEQGTEVNLYKPDDLGEVIEGKRFLTTQDEFYAIADWCKNLLAQDPDASIGIALPGLEQRRTELEYILRKTLYPNSFFNNKEFLNAAYQFSAGEKLSDSEVATMAMNILDLIDGNFGLDQISQILRNPYCFGGRAEYSERLKIDAWLHEKGLIEFDLSTLLDLLRLYHNEKTSDPKPTLFEVSLMTLRTSSGIVKSSYTPSVWAKHFLSNLEKFGWPNVNLNNTEQRHAQAMRSCLTEFATIDFVQNDMDFNLAISSLRRIFMNKRLGMSQVFAPIQILDLKEVHGLNFDFAWIAQLSDTVLPESSQTNPMIPYAWQRKRKISGATPEVRLQEAKQRVRHLRKAAKQTVFSFSVDGDSDQLHAPSMLRDIKFVPQVSKLELPQKKLELELIEESNGPIFKIADPVGTSLFKYQAECPFKAFAKTRLAPTSFEKVSHGLTPIERGQLIHSALELVWLRIGASDTLGVALENDHLEMQIWEIIDKVLSHFESKLHYKLSGRLKTIEQTRLVKLTMAWLKIEKNRVPFELHHSEYNTEVEINGLQVKCRIDRIDEINDIGFAIIDYKSGAHSPNEWFGPRPDQPQMPIYALAEQNKLIAVVYANLKPGNFGFAGLSQLKESFPSVKAFDDLGKAQRHNLTWDGLIPYWREQLSNLAEDYQNGYAVPDPKKGLATCRYCELETLCRVNASSNIRDSVYEGDNV